MVNSTQATLTSSCRQLLVREALICLIYTFGLERTLARMKLEQLQLKL
nr:hypothetical protein Iba_chr04aCG10200 [Ipomoea batatas]GMC82010.1 hypothetical protein Iba_chr04bCG9360 [Ipomoea batatas]GMC84313.1 hypothetical protein Iba_chr04cCG10410 [Ipomoea batatas]GMC86089.1 hypothetical protein Iba_chr04dCG7630 [Ipomoea batatas]GMC88675.1 hypothetical protein Iba_chr04eCG12290 [Ipomoea batatas]